MHKVILFYTRALTILSFLLFPFIYAITFFRKETVGHPRILIVPQLTRVGDIVCSTPVFSAVKEAYPNSFLSVISSAKASNIIKNNPHIDELIIIEDYKDNFLKLIREIITHRFSYGVSLSGTALSSLLFFYGLIPTRIKITRSDRPLSELLTDWMATFTVEYKDLSYLPRFYLKLLEPLNIHKDEVIKEVYWKGDSDERIDTLLKSAGIRPEDKLCGISLTAGNKIKEWGDDKFEKLARAIIEKHSVKVVFTGGPDDRERVDEMILRIGKNSSVNGAGISLEDLPALMNRFSIFVSVDTGPMHIAEALEVPLIDIIGPVNDIELTPRGKYSRIVKAPGIPTTVFAFRETGNPEDTRRSLEAITVEMVLETFDRLVVEANLK